MRRLASPDTWTYRPDIVDKGSRDTVLQDPQASPGAGLPIRVLLAEDDDDHVTLLRRALRGYPR